MRLELGLQCLEARLNGECVRVRSKRAVDLSDGGAAPLEPNAPPDLDAMSQQAAMLSFLDCFWLLGFVAIIGLPLALIVKRFAAARAPVGAH